MSTRLVLKAHVYHWDSVSKTLEAHIPEDQVNTLCEQLGREFSDDQLRAECERRGLLLNDKHVETLHSIHRDDMERADASARLNAKVLHAAEAERDAWKHRAELNEALIATHAKAIRSIYRLCVQHGMAEGTTEKPIDWLTSALASLAAYRRSETKEIAAPRLCAVCGRPADVCRAAPACGEGLERGPGIAHRPATNNDGHWLDPLDLLADDA